MNEPNQPSEFALNPPFKSITLDFESASKLQEVQTTHFTGCLVFRVVDGYIRSIKTMELTKEEIQHAQ